MAGRRLVVEADGGSRGNPGPAGYGAVVRDADSGEVLAEVAAGIGTATNNVAEYRGLIAGLRAALDLQPNDVEVRMDSKLVVEQMSGRWKVKHPDMRLLAVEAADLVRRMPAVRFTHVPRERNVDADRLANEAMDDAAAGRDWQARPRVPQTVPNRLAGWMAPPAPPTTTLLLRHGSTVLTGERRFSGLGDVELSDYGTRQAKALAERVARRTVRPTVVVSSPLRRARQTADAVGAALGVDIVEEPGLRETDFGEWEGLTFAEVQRRWPDEIAAWLADPQLAPPGGESFVATARRADDALARLLAGYPESTLAVVSHVTPIKSLVRRALEAAPPVLYRLHIDAASISEIDWYADGLAVVRGLNDTGHLADVEP